MLAPFLSCFTGDVNAAPSDFIPSSICSTLSDSTPVQLLATPPPGPGWCHSWMPCGQPPSAPGRSLVACHRAVYLPQHWLGCSNSARVRSWAWLLNTNWAVQWFVVHAGAGALASWSSSPSRCVSHPHQTGQCCFNHQGAVVWNYCAACPAACSIGAGSTGDFPA